jgi:hypothetical protein
VARRTYSKDGKQRRSREQNRAREVIRVGRSRIRMWNVRKSSIKLGKQKLSRKDKDKTEKISEEQHKEE